MLRCRVSGLSHSIAIAAAFLAFAASPLAAGAAEPEPGSARAIYASGTVAEIDLDISQESFEALEAEPDEYVPADFTLSFTDGTPGGVTRTLPTIHQVGLRLKGNVGGSFRPVDDKAAFKLKFSEFVKGQKLLGLKKLTLNNMVQDASMLHETLAYQAFRAAGVPAPRTGYAFVRVNGVGYGVYMDVETFDDVALERWFGAFDDETQHLYEGEYGTDVTPGGAGAFEVDEGSGKHIEDLEVLIGAVNAASPAFHTRMEGIADLAEMRRMWAVEKYVGMWDGYAGTNFPKLPNNYFLYSAGPAGPFQMFPWGTDRAWEGPLDFGGDAGLMFDECIADSVCKAAYLDDLRSVGGAVAGLDLESLASCLTDRLAPWRELETPPFREFDSAEVEQGLADTAEVVADRPDELVGWLESQTSEPEQISPSGSPASCAVPELEPEPESEPESKPLGDASPGPVGKPQRTAFALVELRLGRAGVVDARLRTPEPGKVGIAGTIRTRHGVRRVCAAALQAREAGETTLHCRLSEDARTRLRARWLRLHVTVWFQPGNDAWERSAGSLVVPRFGRGGRRPAGRVAAAPVRLGTLELISDARRRDQDGEVRRPGW